MAKVTIKRHDNGFYFTDTLSATGANFTGASVKFLLKRGTTEFEDAAEFVDESEGTVRYQPGASFPSAIGTYSQEWEVTFSDSSVLTFPSAGYNVVKILADLNDA